ncbi:MAG: hypothetical protein RIS92_3020 [Verrucomicrobiota bacterium]
MCGAGKHEVSHFKIALCAGVGGAGGIDFLAEPKGGFTGFDAGTCIANDRREHAFPVNDHTEIAHCGKGFQGAARRDEREGKDDVGIVCSDEKTGFAEVRNFLTERLDGFTEFFRFLGRVFRGGEGGFRVLQFLFPRFEEGVGEFGSLWPAVAGEGLKGGRRSLDGGDAITV